MVRIIFLNRFVVVISLHYYRTDKVQHIPRINDTLELSNFWEEIRSMDSWRYRIIRIER